MTDQNQTAFIQALQEQLAALTSSAQAGNVQAMPGAVAMPTTQPTGVGVPVKLNVPGGTIRVDLMLPAEAVANPQALMAALQQLQMQGWPLDIWAPKNQSWGNRSGGGSGWNQGGGNQGGGWNQGGGRW